MQLTGLDLRLGALNDWLATRTSFGFDLATLAPASSDASFRRYFRLASNNHGSLVVMDAPPDKEDCLPFIKMALALHQAGVSAPRVLDQDLERGFVILTDLGDTTYLKAFEQADALQLSQLMNDAQQVIHRMQDKVDASSLARYDESLLRREMQLFPDWYLTRHCNMTLTDADRNMLDTLFKTLVSSSLGQPQQAVHRDYHCRNLMVLDDKTMDGNPGVLDFQDAVAGAISYDLVSLLRDAYVEWPEQQVLDWTVRFWERAKRRGLDVPQDFADFWQAFEFMGLQRHLKVLGIFARLSHRDGKPWLSGRSASGGKICTCRGGALSAGSATAAPARSRRKAAADHRLHILMRAMILAAGRGERMRPLTDTLPKPLLKVGSKSIIEWQIERLRDAGVRDIIINHAYLGQRIEDELGDGRRFQVKLNYSHEPEALETLGGVVQALRYLGDAPFLLVSGDIYTDYRYQNLVAVADDIARAYPQRAAHLVLVDNPAYHQKGDMGLDQGNIWLDAPLYTYANIGVFHPRLFSGLVRGEKIKLFPWMYRFLGAQRISGELFQGAWSNIGTPADLEQVNRSVSRSSLAQPIDQPVAPG